MERLRVGAFAASAFVGGLAGGFAVQLDIVADPTAYGPLLSFELLVAVLVGGAAAALGPSAGVVVLGLIALLARGLGALAPVSGSRFQPMLEALLVLAVLATGGSALVPAVVAGLRRLALVPADEGGRSEPAAPPAFPQKPLRAERLTKRFGMVRAADEVTLELEPRRITALVGPNGSGKTTVLRILAGALAPDAGTVVLDGRNVTALPGDRRVKAGIVRTLQARASFDELTALENVLVGVNRTRRRGGALRTLVSTPQNRAENRIAARRAQAALEIVGLAAAAGTQASELTGFERQLLMLAAALATRPAVLLLDEPSAGAARGDVRQLEQLLLRLRTDGLAILLVEHNLGLVRATADQVLLISSGRIAASGDPETVAMSDAARAAYGRGGPAGA
jgi:ABC-type branched-subunit amino acid transport system ATPase component